MSNEIISIKVENLTKLFGNNQAIKNLSFEVRKGSIHGFLGPNGAGKSTTMRIIAGVLSPSLGKVYVNGVEVQENLDLIKRSIGILLETPPLYKDMTVKEYLTFVAKIHDISSDLIPIKLNYVLDKLSIENVKDRLIGNLSKGYKQRVGVAQAIIHSPDIVILDEPTVGLDPKSVIDMRNLILELKKDHTILLSSHLLHEVGLICDEVTIIDKGELLTSGTMEDINKKISGTNIITAKVKKFKKEIVKKIEDFGSVKKIETVNNDDITELKIFVEGFKDIRSAIAREIVHAEMELIELFQKKRSLEEIFLQVTGGFHD